VRLTEEGCRRANNIIRRQRLWECFLVNKLAITWDHVHDLAVGSVDAENILAASIIGNTAINNTADDIAFSQIILTPKVSGAGTTEGSLFYDSDDDHLYVYVV